MSIVENETVFALNDERRDVVAERVAKKLDC